MPRFAVAMLAPVVIVLVACGGDDRPPTPVVGDIDAAIGAVEAQVGEPVFFEISATLDGVQLVTAVPVADGDPGVYTAEQWHYADDELDGPTALGEAEGQVFDGDAATINADTIFDGIYDELDDPVITDFAIVSSGDGLVYDATVLSDSGGVIAVQLAPNGAVLAVHGSG